MAERYDNDRERRWRNQSGDRWNEGGQDWGDPDEDQTEDWSRTRQWRRDSDQFSGREWKPTNRGQGSDDPRGYNRDRDDQNYERSRERGSYGENRDWDYGQNQRSGGYENSRGGFGRAYYQDRGNQGRREGRMRGDDQWGAAYGGDRGNYGEPRNRDQGVNRDQPIYNRDWYDWDYEGAGNYEDDFSRNQQYGDTRDVARWRNDQDSDRQGRQRNRGQDGWQSGQQDRWENRSRNQGDPYRTGGMNADWGQDTDYERRDYMNEDLNFRRGDVGYDNEGAFYQDLDEPINNRYGWEVPGRYTGMGPQNYKRTDQRILEDVSERFYNHGRIDASDVEIDVNGGEVTLKGNVPSREMKRLAEDVAVAITGVTDVHNEIKVNPRPQDQGRRPNLTNRGYDLGEDWDQTTSRGQGSIRDRNRDYGDWDTSRDQGASRDRYASDMQRDQNRQDWTTPRAESNVDYGTDATSGVQNRRSQIRQDMEVIDGSGKVVGRVKELRDNDFLVDREMARDIYVPYSAIESVGAQVMINAPADEVDNQGWEKPNIL